MTIALQDKALLPGSTRLTAAGYLNKDEPGITLESYTTYKTAFIFSNSIILAMDKAELNKIKAVNLQ